MTTSRTPAFFAFLAGRQVLHCSDTNFPQGPQSLYGGSPPWRRPTGRLWNCSITPRGERIARIADPRDFESRTSNRTGTWARQPANASEDTARIIGRPTTHGDKSAGVSSRSRAAPQQFFSKASNRSVFIFRIVRRSAVRSRAGTRPRDPPPVSRLASTAAAAPVARRILHTNSPRLFRSSPAHRRLWPGTVH